MKERRLGARVAAPYPVRVKGTDIEGQSFKEETLLENLSAGGSYLQLTRELPEGAIVSMALRLSTAPTGPESALMAARGIVRRVEMRTADAYGVAVEFESRRVL